MKKINLFKCVWLQEQNKNADRKSAVAGMQNGLRLARDIFIMKIIFSRGQAGHSTDLFI